MSQLLLVRVENQNNVFGESYHEEMLCHKSLDQLECKRPPSAFCIQVGERPLPVVRAIKILIQAKKSAVAAAVGPGGYRVV